MPNLENLRKLSKQYVRWHREKHYPVAAQIREWLPRFAGLTDAQVLDTDFKLADAQELVARRHGFDSWPALKQSLPPVPASATDAAAKPKLLAAEPQLFVTDIDASVAFFIGKLGFELAFSYGEPPFYAQVFRDGARLNLRHVDRLPFDETFRRREVDALCATIVVDDAKALFLEYRAAGASFHQPLRKEPWGALTFIVADPDGNLICFAG